MGDLSHHNYTKRIYNSEDSFDYGEDENESNLFVDDTSFDKALIAAVKNSPCLYNKKIKSLTNEKEKAWKNISLELNETGDTTNH